MQKKDGFLVGTVFKLHGYKGDVNIYNNDDILFDFNTIKYFLIEQNNSLVPFFISKARHTKENVILVSLEDVNSEKAAKSLLKQKVYLPIEFLPENDENEISEKQLIGFKVQDMNFGALGEITYINSQTSQQLIYVLKDGEEFCFPMHEQFIIDIDPEKGIMQVELPKELLDLN